MSTEDMEELGAIAKKHGVYTQTCGTNGDFSRYGIHSSGFMTPDILGQASGVGFRTLKHKGMRQGSGAKISIATKSDMVLRDLGLIKTFPDARVSWSV